MRIHVHVESLVLDGVPVEEAGLPRVKEALAAELGRLLEEGGLARELAAGGAFAARRGGALHLTSARTPPALGREIGRAVYGGLVR